MKRDMVDNPAQMYDVCVVCALPEEIRAFLAVVQPFCEEQIEAGISPQHKYEYRFATLKNTRGERLMLHVSWLSRYGPQEMVLHLSRILEEYQPRIVIMTGICAGDARLVQLGDLVVAERTFTYDNGKFTLDEQGRRIHLYDTLTYQLDANLLQFLGLFDDWKPLVAHVKRPASLAEPSRRRKRTCHLKPMASGSAVRADHPFEEVRAPVRGTVAIDMEGAAFGLVMSRHPLIPWLIVKGVCNYADGDKNDIFHDYAARVSALYALSFIQAYVTNERLPPSVESSSPRRAEPFVVWNLPSMRNPFFTGREELLSHLHQVLHDNTAVALTQSYALSGLGGIGKTQMAIEYAYRYRNEYHAVLWATANTSETLMTDFVKIAGILNLPQHKDQDQNKAIQAVKRWLEEHEQWLLILDNVDDFSVLSNFLPTKGSGHILLTTRAQATGTLAVSVDVEKMGVDEGILFLLRRAKLLSKDSYLDTAPLPDRWNAQAIVYALDGLPLALDQAGAYIEETGCSLIDYLERYKRYRIALLKRRAQIPSEYPETVATTWAISFERVERISRAAADLLRCCAFLSPDAIPEEIITGGASKLGFELKLLAYDVLALDHATSILQRYSLVHRIPDQRLLTIHRLVQAVLREEMDEDMKRQWAERIVQAVNSTFPDVDLTTWTQCLRCLPQALMCAYLINEYHFIFPEAAQLLAKAGAYLKDHAQYNEAEPLYLQLLAIRKPEQGPVHPDTADHLNSLGNLYWSQGKYSEAELLYQQALAVRERVLGYTHPDTAQTLNNLGDLYWSQGQSSRAEPYYKQALAIRKQVLGEVHPDTAQSLDRLARLSWKRDKSQAGLLYKQALTIREQTLPSNHPDIAQSLKNLGGIYWAQGKYKEAEPLYERGLVICEQVVETEHPDTAQSLKSLGTLYVYQRKYQEAEPLLLRSLTIRKHLLGPMHLDVAESLHGLGDLYRYQGRYQEAKALYQQAVGIREAIFGPAHPDVIVVQGNIVLMLWKMRQRIEAISFALHVLKALKPMQIAHVVVQTWKVRRR